MAQVYPIVKVSSRCLRKKAMEIKTVTDEHRRILKNMAQAMRENHGIGLAAPQIGVDLKMAVVDAGQGVMNFINPVVVKKTGFDTMEEGCLSVPSTLVNVKRAKSVTIEYIDEWGKPSRKTFEGLAARALQHEIDHLSGRLIIDYLPWYKRILLNKH